ncbi:hypothetical protein P171DRAFT_185746 [Karstenula rhodostoma CBS 690.94]|uniref:Uncharacterized protein n=1 Tax=Karstenula rhodostoma CBS 690.94 TaxID=1392251 RepID=A0A9P4P633_9PLEO|nr:hypothetical protein P171DRAFT_185746 [Karstenula rhodostoma CBS 690.94]
MEDWADSVTWTTAYLSGSIGIVSLATYKTWKYFSNRDQRDQAKGKAAEPLISKAGACGTSIRFYLPENQRPTRSTVSDEQAVNDNRLRFGMVIHLITSAGEVAAMRASDGTDMARLKIMHPDDRYRTLGLGRCVCVRDRIVLREEASGKMLSRARVAEDE